MREMQPPMGSETGSERGAKSLPEVQESLLEHAAPEACTEKEVTQDSPVVKVVTTVTGGRAVFDKEKLGVFFRTHSENYLPIIEDGEVVGIIPMGLLREVFSQQELGRFSNPLSDSPHRQSQSSPSV